MISSITETFIRRLAALICAWALAAPAVGAQTETLTIQVDRPGAVIPSTLFGLFFEDINFAADGGLYPERVKNRSFEFPDPLMGWEKVEEAGGAVAVATAEPLHAHNSHYVRLRATGPEGRAGLTNEGFRGIGVSRGAEYLFSTSARVSGGRGPARLRVELLGPQGQSLGAAQLARFTPRWQKHSVLIRATATEPKARLRVTLAGSGALDVDMVSLYPRETWKNRPNGLRPDLVKLLRDLQPGFLRFPGGCIVEGRDLANRYQWKTTVGDLAARRLIMNRWNIEFKQRPAPDYFQSFGLGFYEYFLLSEDIGAEPLPIMNCGMACQFNTGELAPLDDLDSYIQDVFDLIEFANGPPTSRWGRLRAEMGHPAPFKLKLVGIGNEQWGPQYIERYERFARALKAKHPEITLVSAAGPSPEGERFDFAWSALRKLNAELIDEHYYMPPKWFLSNAARYDKYDRRGPQVFAGEYAAHTPAPQARRNNWEAALSEAAFITGLERNADLVRMASYAPLLAHVDAWQWAPNLIWFDNLRAFGTPSYYVQQVFGTNQGTKVLPVLLGSEPPHGQRELYASASLDERSGEVIIKVVNTRNSPRPVKIDLGGAHQRRSPARGRLIILAGGALNAENSLDAPTRVVPRKRPLATTGGDLTLELEPGSLTVLRLPTR